MEITKQSVVEYLNWLQGSINPISHNEFFNTPRRSEDDMEDIHLYLEEKRKILIRAGGRDLIPILVEIITQPSSVDITYGEYFDLELEEFLKLYRSTPEGTVLKEGILANADTHDFKHLIKVALEVLS